MFLLSKTNVFWVMITFRILHWQTRRVVWEKNKKHAHNSPFQESTKTQTHIKHGHDDDDGGDDGDNDDDDDDEDDDADGYDGDDDYGDDDDEGNWQFNMEI